MFTAAQAKSHWLTCTSAGLCGVCGLDSDGHRRCRICREVANNRRRDRARLRASLGKCRDCPAETLETKYRCAPCAAKERARERARYDGAYRDGWTVPTIEASK